MKPLEYEPQVFSCCGLNFVPCVKAKVLRGPPWEWGGWVPGILGILELTCPSVNLGLRFRTEKLDPVTGHL